MIRSHRSFLVRDMSDSLTSITKNEGMSESQFVQLPGGKNMKRSLTESTHCKNSVTNTQEGRGLVSWVSSPDRITEYSV